MDPSKLKVLRKLPYKIQPCCGLCLHGWFPKDDWGTCSTHTYEHEKHTEGRRSLSIYKFGTCTNFERKPNLSYLGGFEEFLRK
jgi:hypothetical protein